MLLPKLLSRTQGIDDDSSESVSHCRPNNNNNNTDMEYDLQFHYDPRCYLGRTIVMICKEIRAYVTMHLVDLGKGQHKEAWYLAKNPRGLSPNMYDSLTSHDGFNRFNEA